MCAVHVAHSFHVSFRLAMAFRNLPYTIASMEKKSLTAENMRGLCINEIINILFLFVCWRATMVAWSPMLDAMHGKYIIHIRVPFAFDERKRCVSMTMMMALLSCDVLVFDSQLAHFLFIHSFHTDFRFFVLDARALLVIIAVICICMKYENVYGATFSARRKQIKRVLLYNVCCARQLIHKAFAFIIERIHFGKRQAEKIIFGSFFSLLENLISFRMLSQ